MEEQINNPEEVTQETDVVQDDYTSPDDVDINLDEDYVIDWDNAGQTEETDAIQEQETGEVSLGEQSGDSEEVDGSLRDESGQEEYADEGQGEEEGDVELGQVQGYEDEEEDPRYESDEEEYEDDESEEEEEYEDDEWDKLLDFLDEYPNASVKDYVEMTSGADELSDEEVLKMHLASEHGLDITEDADEIDFLFEDTFSYDEELDSERDIKMKQLSQKKALREAKGRLEDLKDKYGADLTFGLESNPEFKELKAFQNEQLEFQKQNEDLATGFQDATDDYFSNEFKGFEFEYGDGKSQRIKANPKATAADQKSISNFIDKYTNEDGVISDMNGYHKALWAANNADALFSHAYEQGKADAVRTAAKSAKNIDMDPRQSSGGQEQTQSGFKLVDEGYNTDNFKINLDNY